MVLETGSLWGVKKGGWEWLEVMYKIKPDFREPEAVLVISYPSLEMDIIVSSLIIGGRY